MEIRQSRNIESESDSDKYVKNRNNPNKKIQQNFQKEDSDDDKYYNKQQSKQNKPEMGQKQATYLKDIKEKSIQKFDERGLDDKFIYVSVSGLIESLQYPNEDYLSVKFDIIATGTDWELQEGIVTGYSQIGTNTASNNKQIVFNFPFDCLYRTVNPFGWPQVVITIFGINLLGRKVIKGYGTTHIPPQPGFHQKNISLFKPRQTSFFSNLFGHIKGTEIEDENPANVLASGEGREVTRVQLVGKALIKFQISIRNIQKLGYKVN